MIKKYSSSVLIVLSTLAITATCCAQSIQTTDSSPTPKPTPIINIHANQLGYYSNGTKKATLSCDSNEDTSPLKWELKNNDGFVVANGQTIPMGQNPSTLDSSTHVIDFSSYLTEGKDYQLIVGDAKSFNFDISNNIYSKMKYDALKFFYHARSGLEIKMPYCVESKWARPAGHLNDISTLKLGSTYQGPDTLDCTGGWYDGADHNKYLVNGGFALWLLQNQYEYSQKKGFSDVYKDNSLNIPESGNGKNDLLDETRWEMEWMLNMQIPSGSEKEGMTYHKVADEKWTPLATRPDQDTQKRLYSPPSTGATLNLAACAAQAARIWKNVDENFSDKCLSAAIKAYAAAKENPAILVSNGPESGSGTYGDSYLDDDFYWAACELYASTKNDTYLTDLKSYTNRFKMPVELLGENKGMPGCFDCTSTGGLGTLTLALVSPNEFSEAVQGIIKAADKFLEEQNNDSYGIPLPVTVFINTFYDTKEYVKGYPSESNSYIIFKSIVLGYAYSLSNNQKYLNGIVQSMDYLIGRNVINKSYISGYGDNPVENPNHRFFCNSFNQDFPSVPPGFLVSGPNSGSNDHMAFETGLKDLKPPAQYCYIDSAQSWATNVVKINFNAALVWVTSYIDYYNGSNNSIPEDINKDGTVNMIDVMKTAKIFGSSNSESIFDTKCDLNGDGCINMVDVMKIAIKFGYSHP